MNQSDAIQKSLTTFVYGLIDLVPLIRSFPAAHAICCRSRVRKQFRGDWNPAACYLKWGGVHGWIGLLNSVALIVIFGLALFAGLVG